MNKTYLRYTLEDTFGVISSTYGNAILDKSSGLAITPALHEVAIWNMRQGTLVKKLKPSDNSAGSSAVERGQVSYLLLSPDGKRVCAGCTTGIVRIYDIESGGMTVALSGHKSMVTAACYNKGGDILVTGGADTHVIVWDVVAERGECRLKGHRDGITDIAFLPETCIVSNGLVSSSKDTLVKIWDLVTQHCVQTIAGHRSEVWSVCVSPCGTRMVTGASDAQIRVWRIIQASENESSKEVNTDVDITDASTYVDDMVAVYMGSVLRTNTGDKAVRVRYHAKGTFLAVQSSGKSIETFKVRSENEAKKKRKRRLKRHREKMEKRQRTKELEGQFLAPDAHNNTDLVVHTDTNGMHEHEQHDDVHDKVHEEYGVDEDGNEEMAAGDEFDVPTTINTHHKVRSIDLSPELSRDGSVSRMLVSFHNNSLELWSCTQTHTHTHAEEEQQDTSTLNKIVATVNMHGHRSDVRAVCISSDDLLIATVGKGEAKVWNARTRQCVRTSLCGFGLCCAFAPGDRHLLVGTKEGRLQILDLSSGDMLRDYEGHEGAVWSLDVSPDGKSMCTGSADGQVKFWDYELTGGNLAAVHTRTLKMADDVLCVRYSRGRGKAKRLIAVAILDATVKVFHEDTLKFFLSLYGHKLPVLSMDISDDGTLLATGSADKTVKIWGMDFGDCHRSILAHSDSIMGVRFVRDTHLFFTVSKDKTVKHWDADRFEKIIVLEGHQAEVWGLCISSDGSYVVTGGHDRSIRIWQRTHDIVFPEEEREKELESMFDAELDRDDKVGAEMKNTDQEQGEEGATGEESASAGRRTLTAVVFGERLIEALDIMVNEMQRIKAHKKAQKTANKQNTDNKSQGHIAPLQPNPFLMGMTCDEYLLAALRKIKPAELEQALLVLPFSQVEPLAACISRLLEKGREVELCSRCAVLLVRAHQSSIVAAGTSMASTFEALRLHIRERLEQTRNVIGRNIAGLELLKQHLKEKKNQWVIGDNIQDNTRTNTQSNKGSNKKAKLS